MFSDYGHGGYGRPVIQRGRIKLRPQKQDVVPAWHGHPRSHGAADAFARNRHLVDFFHIAAGFVGTVETFVIA